MADFTGTSDPDSLTGTDGNDVIQGLEGADTLTGDGGDDVLIGGADVDRLVGGTGDDSYLVDSSADQVIELDDEGTDIVFSTANFTLGANVENLYFDGTDNLNGTGNELGNTIYGNAGNNLLTGNGGNDDLRGDIGNDTLIGGEGNDALSGGPGVDSMVGGVGDDTYSVDSTGDKVIEHAGEGDDTVFSSINYTLGTNVENLFLVDSADIDGTGNDSNNRIYGNIGNNQITGNGGNDDLRGDAGNDTLNGGSGNDALNGQEGSDSLVGGSGDDTLDGGTGSDQLKGGTGNDVYYVDRASDVVTENSGAGSDTVYSTVSHTLAANVENLYLLGTADINGTGNDDANQIVGNDGNNSLSGGGGNDLLVGGIGNDTLSGGSGADSMYGGTGDDVYYVGNAGDEVNEAEDEGYDLVISSISYHLGANVDDVTLTGTANIDATGNELVNYMTGNDGANLLSGLGGDDVLAGGAGSDTLEGGDGDDAIDGGSGVDSMVGGDGNDIYIVGNPGDVIVEQADEGFDIVSSSASSYTLSANVEILYLADGSNALNGTGNDESNVILGNSAANSLSGKGGDDILAGLDGQDTLSGGEGDDTLDGGTGADSLVGGAGDDFYAVDNVGDVVVEQADEGDDYIQSTVSFTLGANIESIELLGSKDLRATGNGLDNHLIGNDGNNSLDGGAGDDYIFGGAGNDTLDGGTGADIMLGGVGDDRYFVNNVGDQVIEQADEGLDNVVATISYTLTDNVENLTLGGSAAIDGAGNAGNNIITGNNAANALTGNEGDDSLDGGAGNDTLSGGDGNDTLIGGSGSDRMIGGIGDDVYSVTSTGDKVVEAADEGTDLVRSSISFTLSANVENLTLTGSDAIYGAGNELANAITGNDAANKLDGLGGDDTLIGGGGDDTLQGGAGADRMLGGSGNDSYSVSNSGDVVVEASGEGTDSVSATISYTLTDHVENLTLSGTAAIDGTGNGEDNILTGNGVANALTGGEGADSLLGGGGADTLDGGTGADVLTGGSGADIFQFSTELGASNVDTITDFAAGSDVFHLSQVVFEGLALGTLAANQFAVGAAATDADQRIIYDAGTGALYFDSDGNGGAAAVQIATLTSLGGALSASNFVVI